MSTKYKCVYDLGELAPRCVKITLSTGLKQICTSLTIDDVLLVYFYIYDQSHMESVIPSYIIYPSCNGLHLYRDPFLNRHHAI